MRHRRIGTRAALVMLVLGSALQVRGASAVTLVQDPERTSTALTGWAWYHGVSAATLSSAISTYGLRITDIEVESATGPKFSATLVKNAGTYARGWWWYYGKTGSQVSSLLSANSARLIDLEPYVVSGVTYFAVVMVSNTGVAAKSWWWYYGTTTSYISSVLAGRRIIDLDSYVVGGVTKWSAVMIANTGVDAKSWWWYYGKTPAQVSSLLSTNHARLIDIERNTTAGYYNVVMVSAGSEYWWWYYGKSASSLGALASQNGARIYDIEPYFVSGIKYFAAIMINDVNAETTRLRQIMANGLGGGVYGIYLKQVGGPTLVNLQEGVRFEPASMIKVVHFTHALRRVRAGADSLSNNVTWYVLPSDPARYPSSSGYSDDKNKCAYNSSTGAAITTNPYVDKLGNVILRQMMQQSDNRTTDATYNRYGRANINATADFIGMTKTELYHRIGCPKLASVQPWHHNELTLYDAGLLYEKVTNGSILGTGTYRTSFFSLISGGALSSNSSVADMIRQEAAAAGLTTSETNSFIANTFAWSKGGSYDICPDSGSCNPPYWYVRTVGGRLQLPFKSSGVIAPRNYVYGRFVDKLSINCTFKGSSESDTAYATRCPKWKAANNALSAAGKEHFRSIVRQAVATW